MIKWVAYNAMFVGRYVFSQLKQEPKSKLVSPKKSEIDASCLYFP